jgi:hypothetical protein
MPWHKPGTDVMITIFCDFWQFSEKKLAFFSKTNVMIKIFAQFSFVLSQKRQFFRWIFRRKYLKNHNIGPSFWFFWGFFSSEMLQPAAVNLCKKIWWSKSTLSHLGKLCLFAWARKKTTTNIERLAIYDCNFDCNCHF